MAKIPRFFQKIFGSTAPASGVGAIGVFGSLAAGSRAVSTNVVTNQSLAAWQKGWLEAIIGNNSPAIEDLNAVMYVMTTQLAYILQSGLPEWDTTTVYYTGSLVNSGGIIYVSLTDGNTGNALTSTANWAIQSRTFRNVSSNTTAVITDNFIRVDASAGPVTITLPPIATALGVEIKIKKVDSSANEVTVKGNASESVDFSNTFALSLLGDSVDVRGNTLVWDIV